MEVSGRLHATVTIPEDGARCTHQTEGWVGLTACLAVVCLFAEIKDAVSNSKHTALNGRIIEYRTGKFAHRSSRELM